VAVITPCLHYTMGGLKINARAEVRFNDVSLQHFHCEACSTCSISFLHHNRFSKWDDDHSTRLILSPACLPLVKLRVHRPLPSCYERCSIFSAVRVMLTLAHLYRWNPRQEPASRQFAAGVCGVWSYRGSSSRGEQSGVSASVDTRLLHSANVQGKMVGSHFKLNCQQRTALAIYFEFQCGFLPVMA